MFKRMSKWLGEHTRIWKWGEKDGALHLISLILTPILMLLFYLLFADVTIPLQILFLSVTFIPPVILGIKSLITKTKFDPSCWFSILFGSVIGGLLFCGIFYLIVYV